MAEAKWSGVLSTTEPRNDVGIIKVRQGNVNSEIVEFQIVQNNKPYDLTGLTVYFCASFGLNLVEKPAVVVNTTGGKIQYTFDDDSMQAVGRQKGYFSINKKEESKVDSTQDFEFQVDSSLMTRSIDGKSYIYKLSTLIKVLDDFIKNGQNNFNTWFDSVKEILYGVDPGGNILRELIEARKNSSGNIFASLKARLDKNEDDTAAQFAQTVHNFSFQLLDYAPNVRTLGAKGDGITDDTEVIQGALDTYGYAFIPIGIFAVSKLVIPDKAQLIGASKTESIIVCIDNNNVTEIIQIPRSSSETLIEKIRVKGNVYKKADGIVYSASEEALVQDSSHTLRSIIVDECRNSYVMGWDCRGFVWDDLESNRSALRGFIVDGTDNIIDKCVSAVSGTDGFLFTGDNNKISNIKAFFAGQNKFWGSGIRLTGCKLNTFTNVEGQENIFDNINIVDSEDIIMQGVVSDGAGCLYKRGIGLDYYDTPLEKRVPIANIKLRNVKGLILDGIVHNRGKLVNSEAWWQSATGLAITGDKLGESNNIRLTVKNRATDGTFKNYILENETMVEYLKRNSLVINGKAVV